MTAELTRRCYLEAFFALVECQYEHRLYCYLGGR